MTRVFRYLQEESPSRESGLRLLHSLPDDVSEELLPDALVDALGGLGLHVEDEGEDAVDPVPHNHLVLGVGLRLERR